MQIGPNGPVPLDPGTYDYDDLRDRLRTALAGSDDGRWARVRGALRAARFFASQIPVIRVLSLSTTQLKEGQAGRIDIIDVIDGVELTGPVPDGMAINSAARTVIGTPRIPGFYTMRLKQNLAGATGDGAEQSFDLTVLMKDGTAPPAPAPQVLQATDIGSDGTPQIDEQLYGLDPVFRFATIIRRRWLFNGSAVTTNPDYIPRVEGVFTYSVDGIGDDGSPINSFATITVGKATVPDLRELSLSSVVAQVGVNKLIEIAGATAGTKITGVVPDGMILNGDNRTIAGTPRTAGVFKFDLTETRADGTSKKTTVTITVDAEAGSDEAVISPPVTSERSMYVLKDEGIIFRKQSTMTGSGPFWTTALAVGDDAFWGPLGVKFIAYSSDDHASGDSGIYLFLTSNPDPKVAASWRTYDQALAAGVFASVSTKPAKNPVFVHEAGASTETPFVMKVGNDWVMHYQTYKLPTSVNQCTNRVLSLDGLNWTGGKTAPLLQPQGQPLGDGHTGYFRCGPNRFDRSKVPFDWVGYSLCGGTDRGMFAQWGTNDPVNGAWTMIQAISPQYGALGAQNAGPTGGDINNARQTRQGVALIANRSGGGSGTANQYGTISEVLLDTTGTAVIAKPIDLVAMPLNADISSQISVASVLTVGQERILMAQGSRAPDANTHVNAIALFSSPRRNPQNTWFDPLALAIPTALTTREVDFRAITAMPASISVFNNSPATGVIGFDSTVGLNLTHPSSGSVRNFVGFFEEIPADATFIDLYITSWRSRGNGAYRDMGFGFWMPDAPGTAIVGLNDGNRLFVGTGGTGNIGRKGSTIAGTTAAENLSQYPSLSYQAASYPLAIKSLGMRWYRAAGRCFLLGEGKLAGGVETEEIAVPTELKPGGSLYGKVIRPRFGLVTQASQANNEQIVAVRARWG